MTTLLAMWGFGRAPPRDSDAQIIAAGRRGDKEALSALYRRNAGPAYSLALRLLGDADRAQDLVQDSFLRAFDRLDSYRGDAPFGAWLRRIVANLAMERLRSERRWLEDEVDLDLEPARSSDPAAQHDALGLLARLPAIGRSVLVLYELEGYSHKEIAALLQRTEMWSKTTLSRTRARLAALLDGEAAV